MVDWSVHFQCILYNFLFVVGCYGDCIPMSYRPVHELLLSLGWALAFCHVRGGGEKGRGWYHAGQGKNKMNSIEVRWNNLLKHIHPLDHAH